MKCIAIDVFVDLESMVQGVERAKEVTNTTKKYDKNKVLGLCCVTQIVTSVSITPSHTGND
jgi:hypothetical protein